MIVSALVIKRILVGETRRNTPLGLNRVLLSATLGTLIFVPTYAPKLYHYCKNPFQLVIN